MGFRLPYSVEMWMWRASGIVVACMIPAFLIIGSAVFLFVFPCLVVSQMRAKRHDGERSLVEPLIVGFAATALIGICTVAIPYIAARLFLVIEAFISVRQMPLGVYVTISWSNYIPHL
jgi:predicted permease